MEIMETEDTQNDEFNMLDFPNEVLLRIFNNLNDSNLLDVSFVCIRFKTIAKETFSRKYNGLTKERYFTVNITEYPDLKMYRPFFQRFGPQMTAIHCNLSGVNEIISITIFLKMFCSFVTHFMLFTTSRFVQFIDLFRSIPNVTHLTITRADFYGWNRNQRFPHLIYLGMESVRSFTSILLNHFVQNHPQLKHVHLNDCRDLTSPLLVLSGLNLNSLTLTNSYTSTAESFMVQFNELESLNITVTTSLIDLAAFKGCKMLKDLCINSVQNQHEDVVEEGQFQQIAELIDIISSFDGLNTLNISGFNFTAGSIHYLVHCLPNLINLSLTYKNYFYGDFFYDDILSLFTESKRLKKIIVSNCYFDLPFNLDFQRRFTKIAENRGSHLSFIYALGKSKIIITDQTYIENGQLQYWIGYELNRSQSTVHFLDLNDKCIDKIASFLTISEATNLYETCKQMKKAVRPRISMCTFEIYYFDIDKSIDWLEPIANDVKKISVIGDGDSDDMFTIFHLIEANCGNHLTELTVSMVWSDRMNELNVCLPNLEKLILNSIESAFPNILPAINCPKLRHLEIGECTVQEVPAAFNSLNLGIPFDNLNTLKIKCFDRIFAYILNSFSENICQNIEEFTVEELSIAGINHSIDTLYNFLIIIVMRFRNLTSLNLIEPCLEKTNTKFLFERCNKLVKLSIGYNYRSDRQLLCEIFSNHIRKNCKELKTVQIVRSHPEHFDERLFLFLYELLPGIQLYSIQYDNRQENPNYNVFRFEKSSLHIDIKPY